VLFNSPQFLVFFPLVTLLYFTLPQRLRWAMLLAASCVFYMYFIPVYILILIFTIVIDYIAGILIENARGVRRRLYLGLSIVANVGVLALFKYFNFINGNLQALAQFIDWNYPIANLGLILPIGLSFHTFQAMSYTIEVYRGNQPAERHFGIYALYVMFYPQLVAGPIERPQNLIHQFRERHQFNYQRVADGLKLMAWGMFKKVVIADRLALLADTVYPQPGGATALAGDFSGVHVLLATLAFAYQIYCDFSGYSDIAIGAAQVMGFRLMTNFDRPYSARSISEFWRRWHISLSTWFRDYLYFPLGGSRTTTPRWYLNLMIVFLVSGLWHGANWTFVIWGALHGGYMVFGHVTQKLRSFVSEPLGLARLPRLHGWLQRAITFALVSFAWIFFRAPNLQCAISAIKRLPQGWPEFFHDLSAYGYAGLVRQLAAMNTAPAAVATAAGLVLLLELISYWQRAEICSLVTGEAWWRRWAFYYGVVGAVLLLGVFNQSAFIYFQF
jgi:alginate O-acetyltransferase complex protein AlgI